MAVATYNQRTGHFVIWVEIDDGGMERAVYDCIGYAGNGAGKNNPDFQHKRNQGPLPRGEYSVEPAADDRFRPPVFRLRQRKGPTFGRSGFLIHGASASNPSGSSHGCIVLERRHREAVGQYDVTALTVYASKPHRGG